MEKEKKKSQGKKKKDKIKSPAPLVRKLSMPRILSVLAAAAIFVIFVMFMYRAIRSSHYFAIDTTEIIWHDSSGIISSYKYDELPDMVGLENIFDVDLEDTALKILSKYQEFENCVINRSFPDRLQIHIYVRQPMAQVKYGKFYLVDKDAILLAKGRGLAWEGFPVIAGVTWHAPGKVGSKYRSNRLFKALLLLNAINEAGFLENHQLHRINVSDIRNLAFFIDDDLQIKIGHKHFRERLSLLEETLSSSYVNKDDLEYIDLRFDDIVFGTK